MAKEEIKSILVRSPNWIGDQILAYPFFFQLRKTYPKARISVVCVSWVQSIQFKNCIDEVIVLPKPLSTSFVDKLKALEEGVKVLRNKGKWDLGISLPNSFSTAWLLFRAGVKQRVGYQTDGRGFLLSDALPWEKGNQVHRAEAYMNLIPDNKFKDVFQFWEVPAENDLDPPIPGVLKSFPAEQEWPQSECIDAPEGPYWVLAPGSTAESRRWPVEYFGQLARRIADEKKNWKGIIVGGPSEIDLAVQLTEDPSLRLEDWTAQGAVSDYWKVFRNAQFSVCNDSGLAHVAALCGSPVQVIWGAGNPKRTEPLGPGKVKILFNPIDCWPCEQNTCHQIQNKRLACLKSIQPESVWEEIKSGIRPV